MGWKLPKCSATKNPVDSHAEWLAEVRGGGIGELQNNLLIVHFPRRYESKRLEIETWIHRMESRAERMGNIAITADILDAQQKEQKVRLTAEQW